MVPYLLHCADLLWWMICIAVSIAGGVYGIGLISQAIDWIGENP